MKLLYSLFLAFSLITTAEVTNAKSEYVLQCGDELISPYRYKYRTEGYDIRSHANTIAEEINFQRTRISTYSVGTANSLMGYDSKWAERAMASISFKDIQLLPSGLGLPDQINGCKVLPVYAQVWGSLLGNRILWNQLSTVDQVLILMDPKIRNGRSIGMLMSEQITQQSLQSFQQTVGAVDYGDLDLNGKCEWYSETSPKFCTYVRGETKVGGAPIKISGPTGFYSNGSLASTQTSEYKFSHRDMMVECPYGSVTTFTPEGQLIDCDGIPRYENREIRYASIDGTIEVPLGSKKISLVGPIYFSEKGQVLLGSVAVDGVASPVSGYTFMKNEGLRFNEQGQLVEATLKKDKIDKPTYFQFLKGKVVKKLENSALYYGRSDYTKSSGSGHVSSSQFLHYQSFENFQMHYKSKESCNFYFENQFFYLPLGCEGIFSAAVTYKENP